MLLNVNFLGKSFLITLQIFWCCLAGPDTINLLLCDWYGYLFCQ